MAIDIIGDFLTIIRNGIRSSKLSVTAPHSRIKMQIAQILKEQGFIKDAVVVEGQAPKKFIKIILKYVDNESVIHEITRISTPGYRKYVGSDEIAPVIGGLGVSILSTNKGIMTAIQAEKLNVGGEVICTVW